MYDISILRVNTRILRVTGSVQKATTTVQDTGSVKTAAT